MRTLGALTAAAALAAVMGFAGPASADKQTCGGGSCDQIIIKGAELQADHALLNDTDEAIFCGVAQNDEAEPWTLHVSISNDTGSGEEMTITFNDGDSITFPIPANSSFSTTLAGGGVPEVDNVVMITATGELRGMASAKTRARAVDPFDEALGPNPDAACGDTLPCEELTESDNYCLTADGDPGSTDANANFPGLGL